MEQETAKSPGCPGEKGIYGRGGQSLDHHIKQHITLEEKQAICLFYLKRQTHQACSGQPVQSHD